MTSGKTDRSRIFLIASVSLAVFLAGLLLLAGCGLDDRTPESAAFAQYEQSHFGFFSAYKSYPFMAELGVHWERPHPGPFIWGAIQKTAGGKYDWSQVDNYVKNAQKYGVQIVATIWPYADWDQQQCHQRLPSNEKLLFTSQLGDYRGLPCDSGAYQKFVRALVDRYNGDGINDMPGLKYPIKYWEVDNEPDVAGGSLFFKGNPQTTDYLKLLEETHDAIKQTDPGAKVLNGGVAYLNQQDTPFWRSILSGPGANDIDIMTIHAIEMGTDLQLPALNTLMRQLDFHRPVWVTEIQYLQSFEPFLRQWADQSNQTGAANTGAPAGPDLPAGKYLPGADSNAFKPPPHNPAALGLEGLNQEQWSVILVQSFVQAFGNGATKLFYIGLDNSTPTEPNSLLVRCRIGPGAGRNAPYAPADCQRQKPFYAYKTMVDKLDYFDSVKRLAPGQYRFVVGGHPVYVLWGSGPLPAGIGGRVTVTDIYGHEHADAANKVKLSGTPIYVKPDRG